MSDNPVTPPTPSPTVESIQGILPPVSAGNHATLAP